MEIDGLLRSWKEQVDRCLDSLLPRPDGHAGSLAEAMRYAVLGGGKRLRPILTLATCRACGGPASRVLEPAAAIEMIHTYSLVHDDLPAMDDDDLRRGRPTVHRAFGEADAILVGDALQALAFEILASRPEDPAFAARRSESTLAVARRAGAAGMVAGQVADLEAARARGGGPDAEWIHRHKTGALFSAAAEVGAIHAGANVGVRAAAARYGEWLGVAFQITDDILDLTATAEQLGKTPGKDQRAGKCTYPAAYGLERSRQEADRHVDAALTEVSAHMGDDAVMAELARHGTARSR